jgi:hypothetical protein
VRADVCWSLGAMAHIDLSPPLLRSQWGLKIVALRVIPNDFFTTDFERGDIWFVLEIFEIFGFLSF